MFGVYPVVKRALDVILALICLIALSPVFVAIAVAIVLDSGLPVLFRQKRIGVNRTTFRILKFRTMYVDTPRDTPTHQLENPDQYITRIGRFLRRTSLDELPQILNILAGDMSFVGPRPALWNQDDLVAEREKYGANQVRPGLTGWAQINGRDELPIDVKARLDGEYVKQIGFWIDVKCMLGTVMKVVTSDGVVEGSTGVMSAKRNKGETLFQ